MSGQTGRVRVRRFRLRLTSVLGSDRLEIEVKQTKFWEKNVKKAQVLGALLVAGALGMAVSGNAMAAENPSMSAVKNATDEARKVAEDARKAGKTDYAEYLENWVAQGNKAQNGDYYALSADEVTELVNALSDGAFVTRLMIRTSEISSQTVDGALPEPRTSSTTSVKNASASAIAEEMTASASASKAVEVSSELSAKETNSTKEVAEVSVSSNKASAAKVAKQALANPSQEKVVLATAIVASTETQVSAPDTSAGRPEATVAVVASAEKSVNALGVVAALALAVGALVRAIEKMIPRKEA